MSLQQQADIEALQRRLAELEQKGSHAPHTESGTILAYLKSIDTRLAALEARGKPGPKPKND